MISGDSYNNAEMEKQEHSLDSLMSGAETYVDMRMEMLKLKFADKAGDALSEIATAAGIFTLLAFSILIISIGFALLLGDLLGKSSYGFFVTGGIYAIAGFLYYINRRKWLKTPLDNFFIRTLLNKQT